MKRKIETEMYCLQCGEIDESYTAYCSNCGRSSHGLRNKKTKEEINER